MSVMKLTNEDAARGGPAMAAASSLTEGGYPLLSRTRYDDDTGATRSGDSTHEESRRDLVAYVDPLMQAHARGLHGAGVVEGLRVSGRTGDTQIRVEPGVALDGEGRHVWLMAGGLAELDPDAGDKPPHLPDTTVPLEGVSLSTAGLTGARYVTIAFRQSNDPANPSVRHHTPWLRIVAKDGFADDGVQIVIAEVTLKDGVVESIGHDKRRLTAPAGGLTVRAPWNDSAVVQDIEAGQVRPRAGGGLEITVPSPADGVRLATTGGDSFSVLEVAAARLHVAGALQVDATATVAGDLEVAKRTTLGFLAVADASVFGALSVAQTTTLGTLTVTGDSSLSGTLSVTKAATLSGLSVTHDASVSGALSVTKSAKLGSLTVSGDASVSGSLSVTKSMAVNGDATIKGTIAAGSLKADGASSIGPAWAPANGHMARGSLTIGNIGASFGGGSQWNANTAGLLLETAANTEIAVHDSNTRIASLMYYQGDAANKVTIGRDMGWGRLTEVDIDANIVRVSGNTILPELLIADAHTQSFSAAGGSVSATKLGIGRDPEDLLDIDPLGSPGGILLRSSFDSNEWLSITWHDKDSVGFFYKKPHTGGILTQDGRLVPASDRSCKENIADLQGILSKVERLRPVSFDWKAHDGSSIGFIAQEVEAEFPELVHAITHPGAEPIKGLDYASFGVLAIAALREMKASYDARIAALEAQLAAASNRP